MSSEGQVPKTESFCNPRFLNSCRGWAGKIADYLKPKKQNLRLAALAKAKSECISNYNAWLAAGSSGEFLAWDTTKETCTRSVFAFEGIQLILPKQ